jgi:hypothetical protein
VVKGPARGNLQSVEAKSRCWRLRVLLSSRSSFEQTKMPEKTRKGVNGHGLGSEAGVAGFRAGMKGVMVYRCQALHSD